MDYGRSHTARLFLGAESGLKGRYQDPVEKSKPHGIVKKYIEIYLVKSPFGKNKFGKQGSRLGH